jgi:hypothetical protein
MPTSNAVETHRKLFTVESANKALPLVKVIVSDIVRQFEIVRGLTERLSAIASRNRKPAPGDPYWDEVAQMQTEKDAEESKLNDYIEELVRLGVELKGPDGLCDFPSIRDGREIYLCWRLGEEQVQHWHELHTGFAGRQPLRAAKG